MLIELVLITIILLSVISYENKTVYVALSILMVIFFAFTTKNADFLAYIGRYTRAGNKSNIVIQEPAFGFMMFICNRLGFSYNKFLIILSLFGLIIIYKCLTKYSDAPTLILALYFLIFFSGHIVQIRAFIAEWIVIFALLYLLTEEDAKKWKYILLIVLAAAFQAMTLFFLLFVMINHSRRFELKASIVVIAFFLFLLQIRNILVNSSIDIFREKASVYLNTTNRHISFSSIIFAILFFLMLLYVLGLSKNCIGVMGETWGKRFKMMSDANTLALIPLTLIFIYGNNFFRYNRVVILVNIILLVNFHKERKKTDLRTRGMIACACLAIFIMGELMGQTWYYQIIHNDLLSKIL